MLDNVQWIFFDIGSTIMDERLAYEHRLRDIAELANTAYEDVYETAMQFYRQNKKGDLETAKLFGVALTQWHAEDERLYADAAECLAKLSEKYKLGMIANQSLGSKDRLAQHGVLQYFDLVIASAEEGCAKPDERIFRIALERSGCQPNSAIMIGDRIDNDIIPAKALGMRTVWVKQGFGRFWNVTREMEKADLEVNNLTELSRML